MRKAANKDRSQRRTNRKTQSERKIASGKSKTEKEKRKKREECETKPTCTCDYKRTTQVKRPLPDETNRKKSKPNSKKEKDRPTASRDLGKREIPMMW